MVVVVIAKAKREEQKERSGQEDRAEVEYFRGNGAERC